MARAVIVCRNEDKGEVLFIPEGQRRRPTWSRIYLRYSANLSRIEMIEDNGNNDAQRIIGEIHDTRVIVSMIKARHFYCGWVNDAGAIEQIPIECRTNRILP